MVPKNSAVEWLRTDSQYKVLKQVGDSNMCAYCISMIKWWYVIWTHYHRDTVLLCTHLSRADPPTHSPQRHIHHSLTFTRPLDHHSLTYLITHSLTHSQIHPQLGLHGNAKSYVHDLVFRYLKSTIIQHVSYGCTCCASVKNRDGVVRTITRDLTGVVESPHV